MDQLIALEHAAERRRQLARIVGYSALGIVLAVVIALAVVFAKKGYDAARLAWNVATVFVLIAVPISAKDVQDHLLHFEVPELQKYEIRILLMIPIYSLTSWICLENENEVLYRFLDAFRSLYEAFVIWNFTYFLCAYLGPTEEMLAIRFQNKPDQEHLWPLNWILRPWKMGHEFVFYSKFGTLQYVFWKILNVFIVFFASVLGIYGEGEWTPTSIYFLTTIITNISQMVALYSLVLFYFVTSEDLAPLKPLTKFLCVKMVVFFCFWQGCVISAMVYIGLLKNSAYFPNAANSLQDFIVCVEMLFFSIAHHYAFSYKDFSRLDLASGAFSQALLNSQRSSSSDKHSSGSHGKRLSGALQAFLETANPKDLFHDINHSFRQVREGSQSGSSYLNDDDDGDDPDTPLASLAVVGADQIIDSPLLNEDCEFGDFSNYYLSECESILLNREQDLQQPKSRDGTD